jgi:hypothetical protein
MICLCYECKQQERTDRATRVLQAPPPVLTPCARARLHTHVQPPHALYGLRALNQAIQQYATQQGVGSMGGVGTVECGGGGGGGSGCAPGTSATTTTTTSGAGTATHLTTVSRLGIGPVGTASMAMDGNGLAGAPHVQPQHHALPLQQQQQQQQPSTSEAGDASGDAMTGVETAGVGGGGGGGDGGPTTMPPPRGSTSGAATNPAAGLPGRRAGRPAAGSASATTWWQ